MRGFFVVCLGQGPCFKFPSESYAVKSLVLMTALVCVPFLSACTVLAIADAAGSAVVYGVKTTVNVLDAVTPDMVNKKKKKD
jgi:hypothetical protein